MKKNKLEIIDKSSNEFINFFETSNGIKMVPEFYKDRDEKFLQRDGGSFAKWIYKNHNEIKIEYDPNVKKISLNNSEYWLPLVFLASDTSIQIYIGLVVNFVYDKLKGALSTEKDAAKVNFSVEYKEKGVHKKITYSGDIKGLEKFRKIDINEIMSK